MNERKMKESKISDTRIWQFDISYAHNNKNRVPD